MRCRLTVVSFVCLAVSISLHADLGTSWNNAYNRAFKLLEKNPLGNEQEIIAIATELKDLAQKLKVADFITRSQDPLEALEIHHILEEPTPTDIKEIERKIRWYAQQKRKRLVDYLNNVLKKRSAIQPSPGQTVSTKPYVPSKPIAKPASQQESRSETQEVIPEQRAPLVQKEKKKSEQETLIQAPISSSEQESIKKKAEELKKALQVLLERIAGIARMTTLGQQRGFPQDDIQALTELTQKLTQKSITFKTLREIESALALATRIADILAQLKDWQSLEEDDFDALLHVLKGKARSSQSVSFLVGQLQREIDKSLAEAKELRTEVIPSVEPKTQAVAHLEIPAQEKSAESVMVPQEQISTQEWHDWPIMEFSPQPAMSSSLMQQSTQKLLESDPVEYFQVITTYVHSERQRVEQIVAANRSDRNLQRIAPSLLELLKAQENLSSYFLYNLVIAREIAQQPSIVARIMAGKQPKKEERGLIVATGIKPAEIKILQDLSQKVQAASQKALDLVQQDPENVSQVFKTHNLPLAEYVQEAIRQMAAEPRIEVIQEELSLATPPQQQAQLPVLIQPSQSQQRVDIYKDPEEMATEFIAQQAEQPKQQQEHSVEKVVVKPHDDAQKELMKKIAILKGKVEKSLEDALDGAKEYEQYLTQILEALKISASADKESLSKLLGVQQRAYDHITITMQALMQRPEWNLKDFDLLSAYNTVAEKVKSIKDLDPYTEGYSKDFIPRAIEAIIEQVYYKPKREKINVRVQELTQKINAEINNNQADQQRTVYRVKLKSLIDKLSGETQDISKADQNIGRIKKEYDNLVLLVDVSEASVDWNLTKDHAQAYKALIEASDGEKQNQLTKEQAGNIVEPLLENIRKATIRSQVERALKQDVLAKINLDKAIGVGIGIKNRINDVLIFQAIKQAAESLEQPEKMRLSPEQVLEATLGVLNKEERASLIESFKEVLLSTITAEHDALEELFNDLNDDGLRYYLLTLVRLAQTDDDELANQKELLALTKNSNEDAIKKLTELSEKRPGLKDDLDSIRGAMIFDWGKYWNTYGGIRRIMTQKQLKELVAQAQQWPLKVRAQEITKAIEIIDKTLLSDLDKRRLATLEASLKAESLKEHDLSFMEKTLQEILQKEVLATVKQKLGNMTSDEIQNAENLIKYLLKQASQEFLDYQTNPAFKQQLINSLIEKIKADVEEGGESGGEESEGEESESEDEEEV